MWRFRIFSGFDLVEIVCPGNPHLDELIFGEKPAVRKVSAMLGGGSQGRIAAVLKELHLPEPKPSEPEIPPYLVDFCGIRV